MFGGDARIAPQMFAARRRVRWMVRGRIAWVRAGLSARSCRSTSSRRDATIVAGLAERTRRGQGREGELVAYLGDPIEELRVAAAVALRRAGDPAGADVLLKAIEDPVEGPEVRWALTKLAGDHRGDTAGAWANPSRAGGAQWLGALHVLLFVAFLAAARAALPAARAEDDAVTAAARAALVEAASSPTRAASPRRSRPRTPSWARRFVPDARRPRRLARLASPRPSRRSTW